MRRLWVPVFLLIIAAVAVLLHRKRDEGALTSEVVVTRADAAESSPPATTPPTPAVEAAEISATQPNGTGSERDPYRLNWPLLIAAEHAVSADGSITVPKEIAKYDGTHVEISGFLAPPVAVDRTSELLVMRNRWDGCCIGTPPTAFDCVEATLAQSVPVRGRHLIAYGTIRGRLRIEPFRVGRYLLGLYRIEEGTVDGLDR